MTELTVMVPVLQQVVMFVRWCLSRLPGTLWSRAECRSNPAWSKNGKKNQVPFRLQIFRLFSVAGYCWGKPGGMWGCCHVAFCRSRVATHAWEEGGPSSPQGLGGLAVPPRGCSLLPLPSEPGAVWFGIQGSGEMPQFGPRLFFCLWVTSGALLRVPRKRP